MSIPLDQVEQTLTRLWEEEVRSDRSVAHATLLNLVVLVSHDSLLERAQSMIAELVKYHAARTITVTWTEEGTPEIEADVGLYRTGDTRNSACGERIFLRAHGTARLWVPENIERLALSGLPYIVWWVGDLPDRDNLLERIIERADLAVVNSAEMDLRDLVKLADVADKFPNTALTDLTWVRLRGLQDLIARFFDDPETRPYLEELTQIHFSYSCRESETDVASTRVGLLLGWLCQALDVDTDRCMWSVRKHGGDVFLGRENPHPPVHVRIAHDRRPGVHDGALTRIELRAGQREQAKFLIERQEDPSNVLWSLDVPGLNTPSQLVRFESHFESNTLRRTLERPERDVLFESSLRAARSILKAVAPRLTSPPTGK